MSPPELDPEALGRCAAQTYAMPVAAVLPLVADGRELGTGIWPDGLEPELAGLADRLQRLART